MIDAERLAIREAARHFAEQMPEFTEEQRAALRLLLAPVRVPQTRTARAA